MDQRYGTFVTDLGKELIAEALAKGEKLNLMKVAVGDGGGEYYIPTPDMIKLRRQMWSGDVNSVDIGDAANTIEVVVVVPSNVGGFTIREMAIFTAEGEMFAICNTPETEKVIISSGAIGEMELVVRIEVSNTDAITFIVDPNVVLATKSDIDKHNKATDAHEDLLEKIYGEHNPPPLQAGKKQTTFIIGTTQIGHTVADVDYLCDGIADQVEINAAITALSSCGGKIVIREGLYNITAPISIDKDDVTLEGMGNSSILKRMFTGNAVVNITASNATVMSMKIDGNRSEYSNNNNNSVNIHSDHNTICDIICDDNNTSIYISNGSYNIIKGNTGRNNMNRGVDISKGSHNTLNDNIWDKNLMGIIISNGSNNTVSRNICSNSSSGISMGGSMDSVVIGNTCNNNSYGIALGSGGKNTITGNTCNNNNQGIFINTNSKNNTIVGNTCIRESGLTSDYTSAQHTINIAGSQNLVSSNNIMGKNYTDVGANNTFANNKYE